MRSALNKIFKKRESQVIASLDVSNLTVFEAPYEKIRVGKSNDGGYVICDIPNLKYDVLLSAGIETDSSFEDMFLEKHEDINCFAYDGTIERSPSSNIRFKWTKKNIGAINDIRNTNLHDMLNSYNTIFLKMDIEGYEIPWFETLNQQQMDKLCQIAIEFHSPFSERENAIFRKLNNTHVLIHFHGNNCCGVKTVQGVDIPNVFECTYIHKKYFSLPKQLNISQVPSLLDQPNLVSKPEIYLNYKPFNNLS